MSNIEKIESSLTKYTTAVEAVKQHETSNERIFAEHKKLVMAVIDAENNLRDEAAQADLEGVTQAKVLANDGSFRVIITPQTMKVYDEDKILAAGLKDAISEQKRPPRITISGITGQQQKAVN